MRICKIAQSIFVCIFIFFSVGNTAAQCIPPSSSCASLARLSNVTFGTINNNSTCSSQGYINYTGTVTAPNLGAGVMYPISVTCDYGTYAPANFAVWIDYNHNSVFESSEYTNLGTITGLPVIPVINTIMIPPTALTGLTKMRVRVKSTYSSSEFIATDACSTITYGETEDYSINIITVPVCSGLPAGGTTIATSNSVCPGADFTLTVTGAATEVSGLTFQWQTSPNGSSWTDILNANAIRLVISQTSATYYRRKITCSNGQSGYSSSQQITVNPYNLCYCIPAPSNCSSFPFAGIDSVSFSNLHNGSTCGTNGYTDYTASTAPANIQAGTYVPVFLKFNINSPTVTKYVAMAIDFNHNGLFDQNEISDLNSGTATLSRNVRIPFNALTGITRMRIRVADYTANMCSAFSNAEAEDYIVNIAAATSSGPNFSFYVNPLASGNGNGLSWSNAFTNLMTTLDFIQPSDTVRIAKATYAISGFPYYFNIKDSVVLMGGYPASGNPSDALRNWASNQTILSGAGTISIVQGGNRFTLDGFILQDIYSYPNEGGAVKLTNSVSPKIKHCVFRNNRCVSTNGSGSAIKITNSSPEISDCFFINNKDDGGSSIFAQSNSIISFTNCIFSKNSCDQSMIASNQSSVNLVNCDFVSNRTVNNKTISLTGSTLSIKNSIFFNNETQNELEGYYSIDSTDISLINSTATLSNTITQAYDYGNTSLLSRDPKFKDTSNIAGPDNLYFTSDDGLQLVNPCSPGLNAGSNAAVSGLPKDILGNARIFSSLVDLGAYEVQSVQLPIPTTVYVNNLATGNGSGTSWTNAFPDLQAAMLSCSDTVRVAAGTYFPSNTLETKSFWLENKRVLLGGYPNTGSPTDAQRNPSSNLTILSGQLPNAGGQQSYNIIRGRSVDSTSVTDGFQVTNANSSYSTVEGAIHLVNNANPIFRNCVIKNNVAATHGAGLLNADRARPRFENSIFEYNQLSNLGEGGAVANILNANPVFVKCIFRYNSNHIATAAPSSGGAVYNSGSNPVFDSCTFLKNVGNNWAGAMDNVNSNPIIKNCQFLGNYVTPGGTGGGNSNDINNNHSNPQIFNTFFSDSSGRNFGGSILNQNQSNPFFIKCVFDNCYGTYGGICYNDNSNPVFSGCVFKNSVAGYGNICSQNYSNPVFINCLATGLMSNNGSFLYNDKSFPIVKNTTVSNNSGYLPPLPGAVVVNMDSSRLTISNSIFWGNLLLPSGEITDPVNTTTPTLMNNCITQIFGITGVNGNLTGSDPLFVNQQSAAGPDNTFFTNDDGLSLASCSPAYNAGLNASIIGFSTDILNNTRVFNGTVDMGAYEIQGSPALVTNSWTGTINNSWENPQNWSLGIVPNACTQVIVNSGTVILNSNATIYNLTAGAAANITVLTGYNLIILH